MTKTYSYKISAIAICLILALYASMLPGVSANETTLLSQGKQVFTSSVAPSGNGGNKLTDGTAAYWESGWAPSGVQYATVDLGALCEISEIKVMAAPGNINSRTYFRVLASQDLEFESYTEIVPQPQTAIPEDAETAFDVTSAELFRFVRIERTNYTNTASADNAFVVRELSVYGEVKKENILRGSNVVVETSSQGGGNEKTYLNDGRLKFADGYWSSDWTANGAEWCMFDMGAFYTIEKIDYFSIIGNEQSRKDFTIYTSSDKETWTELVRVGSTPIAEDGMTGFSGSDLLHTNECRYIKFMQNADPGGQGFAIAEVSVFGEFVRKAPVLASVGIVPTSNISVASGLSAITDANTSSFVEFINPAENVWIQIDLGSPYYLSGLGVYVRNNSNDNMLRNFKIMASDKEDGFDDSSTHTVLWEGGADYAAENNATATKEVTEPKAYRYIRYVKTADDTYLLVPEISVYGMKQDFIVTPQGFFSSGSKVTALTGGSTVSFEADAVNSGDNTRDIKGVLVLSEKGRVIDAAVDSETVVNGAPVTVNPSITLPATVSGKTLSAYLIESFAVPCLLSGEVYAIPSADEVQSFENQGSGTSFAMDYYNNIAQVSFEGTPGDKFLVFITAPDSSGNAQVISDSDSETEIKAKLVSVLSGVVDQSGEVMLAVPMNDTDSSGDYTAKIFFVTQESATPVVVPAAGYISASERQPILAGIKTNLSTAADFESFVTNCRGNMLRDIDLQNAVYAADKESIVTSIAAALSDAPTVKEIVDVFRRTVKFAEIASASVLTVNHIDELVEIFELDDTYYTSDVKAEVAQKMGAANQTDTFETADDVKNAFDEAVFLISASKATNTSLTGIVNHYGTRFGLDYGIAEPHLVNNTLTDVLYNNVGEFKTAFEARKSQVLVPVPPSIVPDVGSTGPSGNSGGFGGGSGGGGGVSFGVAAKPKEPANSTMNNPATAKTVFTDIDNVPWAVEAINYLSLRGINGKGDGKFAPNDTIKREEGAKMLLAALGTKAEETNERFNDAIDGAWYTPYLSTVSRMGYFMGDENGNFGVGKELSRQNFAVVLYRAMQNKGKVIDTANASMFADEAEIASYAKKAVETLSAAGIINGKGDGRFAPKASVTRAEAAKMLYGMVKFTTKGGAVQ